MDTMQRLDDADLASLLRPAATAMGLTRTPDEEVSSTTVLAGLMARVSTSQQQYVLAFDQVARWCGNEGVAGYASRDLARTRRFYDISPEDERRASDCSTSVVSVLQSLQSGAPAEWVLAYLDSQVAA